VKCEITAVLVPGISIVAGIVLRPEIGKATSNGRFSQVETGTGTVTGDGTRNYLEFCDTYLT
jgi:hypothetical protein